MSDPNQYDRLIIASRCLAGLLANPSTDTMLPEDVAEEAVMYADALLTALSEPDGRDASRAEAPTTQSTEE